MTELFAISQGHVCWYDFGAPEGATPAKRRPVVVVQSNGFNRSRLGTVLVVPLSGNLDKAAFSHNVFVPARLSQLPRDSVAVTHEVSVLRKTDLNYPVGILPTDLVRSIVAGINSVLAVI